MTPSLSCSCRQLTVVHPAPPNPGQVAAAAVADKMQIWVSREMNSLSRSVVKGG